MIIQEEMCYSRLLYLLTKGHALSVAVSEVTFSKPEFTSEGFTGHIKTNVTFKVVNLSKFTWLYEESAKFPDGWYEKVILEDING